MKILSIETSCDDTGVSIMEVTGGITNASFKLLADASNSQIKAHIPYGGVYPALAKREHQKNLPILLEEVLKQAKITTRRPGRLVKPPVDLIAVTYGPGLEMCLWEGITFAKSLAEKWSAGRRSIPVMPTDHMEGHIMSVFGKKVYPGGDSSGVNKKVMGKFTIPRLKIPILSLLVSGGHTQLILSKKWMQYEIIGETVDDAVGEAYDKVARMLGLPYPGGPEISKLADKARARLREIENKTSRGPNFSAKKFNQSSGRRPVEFPRGLFSISLPRPMLHSKNFNFSYSGLKTAVLYLIRDLGGLEKISEKTKQAIALEFENAAIECLVYKTKKAIEQYKIKTLIVGGGVSCNAHLRSELQKVVGKKVELLMPQKELTGDNSLMIGIAGYLEYIKNKKKVPKPESIKAEGNVKL